MRVFVKRYPSLNVSLFEKGLRPDIIAVDVFGECLNVSLFEKGLRPPLIGIWLSPDV